MDEVRRSIDAPTFVLILVSAFAGVALSLLSLSGIGLMSAAFTIAAVRFFGRPNVAAFFVLAALAAIIGIASASPSFWITILAAYYRSFAGGWHPAALATTWLNPASDTPAKVYLIAYGVFFGGAVELLIEDRRNSKLAHLATGKPARRRAPIAFICAWLAAYRSASHRDTTLLGTDVFDGRSLLISDADLRKHALILGTTGKGKTTTLMTLAQASMQKRQFCVYLDGKGDVEMLQKVRKMAEAEGRPFYVFNTLEVAHSCAYNPLASGDYTSKADRVMNLREWTEPHYESLAAAFLQTAFKILDHLGIVIDVVQASKSLSSSFLIKSLRAKDFSPAKQALANEIAEQVAAEKSSIDSLRSDLRYIANGSLGILFDTTKARDEGRPVLNLELARREGAVVYFLLSPLLFQKAAPKIAKLILNDLKAITVSARSIFKLFVDESTFATEAALNLVNMGRSFRVCVVFSSQTTADFSAGARELGQTLVRQVLASVNLYIIHQLNEPDEAELMGRLIGTASDVELTAQSQDGELTGLASSRHVREFRVHPDDFKAMRTGEAFVVNKNDGSIRKIKIRQSKG